MFSQNRRFFMKSTSKIDAGAETERSKTGMADRRLLLLLDSCGCSDTTHQTDYLSTSLSLTHTHSRPLWSVSPPPCSRRPSPFPLHPEGCAWTRQRCGKNCSTCTRATLVSETRTQRKAHQRPATCRCSDSSRLRGSVWSCREVERRKTDIDSGTRRVPIRGGGVVIEGVVIVDHGRSQ